MVEEEAWGSGRPRPRPRLRLRRPRLPPPRLRLPHPCRWLWPAGSGGRAQWAASYSRSPTRRRRRKGALAAPGAWRSRVPEPARLLASNPPTGCCSAQKFGALSGGDKPVRCRTRCPLLRSQLVHLASFLRVQQPLRHFRRVKSHVRWFPPVRYSRRSCSRRRTASCSLLTLAIADHGQAHVSGSAPLLDTTLLDTSSTFAAPAQVQLLPRRWQRP